MNITKDGDNQQAMQSQPQLTKKGEPRKSNAGRKTITDNKEKIILFVRKSIIEANGGEDGLKDSVYRFLDQD